MSRARSRALFLLLLVAWMMGARSLRGTQNIAWDWSIGGWNHHPAAVATAASCNILYLKRDLRSRSVLRSSINLHQTRAANWVSNLGTPRIACMHACMHASIHGRGNDTRARARAPAAPHIAQVPAFSQAQNSPILTPSLMSVELFLL